MNTFISSLNNPALLPENTSLVIIWCGNHIRLRRLIQSTQCSVPIYADPHGQIYQLLGKTCTATSADSSKTSTQHVPSSAAATFTKFARSARVLREGNPLNSGITGHYIGTAFLFEANQSICSTPKLGITWSYRISSGSVLSEVDVIRRMLGIKSAREENVRGPRTSVSTKGTQRSSQETALKSGNTDRQRVLGSLYGLPTSHRRAASCTEGLHMWRPRLSCLAC